MYEQAHVADMLPCLALLGDEALPGTPPMVIVLVAQPGSRPPASRVLVLGDRRVDFGRCRVTGPDLEEVVTAREMDLLQTLAARRGQVVSREDLVTRVWGREGNPESSVLDVTVYRLRRKIEPDPSNPSWLVSVRGRGFVLEEDPGATRRRPLPMAWRQAG